MDPYEVIQRFQHNLSHAYVFHPMRLESMMKQFDLEDIECMQKAYYCKSKLDAYYDLMQNIIVKFLAFAEFRQQIGKQTVDRITKQFNFHSLINFYRELRSQYLEAYSNYIQILPIAQQNVRSLHEQRHIDEEHCMNFLIMLSTQVSEWHCYPSGVPTYDEIDNAYRTHLYEVPMELADKRVTMLDLQLLFNVKHYCMHASPVHSSDLWKFIDLTLPDDQALLSPPQRIKLSNFNGFFEKCEYEYNRKYNASYLVDPVTLMSFLTNVCPDTKLEWNDLVGNRVGIQDLLDQAFKNQLINDLEEKSTKINLNNASHIISAYNICIQKASAIFSAKIIALHARRVYQAKPQLFNVVAARA